MTDLELAKEIAHRAHKYQQRRNGEPYISHVRRIVETLVSNGASEETIAAAWLHDVAEDSDVDLPAIATLFLSPGNPLYEAVSTLTRRRTDTYVQYIAKVKENPIATQVKLADLNDNLRDNDNPDQIERYTKAIIALTT